MIPNETLIYYRIYVLMDPNRMKFLDHQKQISH